MGRGLAVTALLLLLIAGVACEAYNSMTPLRRFARGICECCNLSLHDRCCTQCLVRLGKRGGGGSAAQEAEAASFGRSATCRCCEESGYTDVPCCLACKLSLAESAAA